MEFHRVTYKCRICEAITVVEHEKERGISAESCLTEVYEKPSTRFTVHNCEDGKIGVADLMGIN